MINGIDRSERIRFSVSGDKGEPKTVFFLGTLTQRDKIAIFGQAVDKSGAIDPRVIQEKAVDIFLKGVKRIENLSIGAADGVKSPASFEPVTEEVADTLPFEVLIEVVSKVMEINFVGESERKN